VTSATSPKELLDQARTSIETAAGALASLAGQLPQEAPTEPPAQPLGLTGLQQPAAFYDYIRGDTGELFPKMSQSQMDGTQALITAGAGTLPLSWMAYVLATAYHETNRTMQPVKEAYWLSEDWRKTHLK
jgi:hypothetical protein